MSAYPPGFSLLPEAERNQYFADQARDYAAQKKPGNGAAKNWTRDPDYLPPGEPLESAPFAPAGAVTNDAPQFSEDQIALVFSERHAADLRYVALWCKWYRWTGTHWAHEATLAAYDLARKVCREVSAQCDKPGEAKAIAKAKTVAAIEQLARSDRRSAATIEQWDDDKDILNTPAASTKLKRTAK
jgi:phage/plasmid-associated DNA primase